MNITFFKKRLGQMWGSKVTWLPAVFSAVFVATLILAPDVAHAQGADVGRKLLGYIMEPFVAFFALLVYVGGVALNASAYFSIVQMGNLVNASSGLAIAWDLFRDLGNIVIVFGFIAVGITTILDLGQYNAKRMLATLLIVALLMNFSSLIARGVIDVGNVVGLQFYKAINGGQLPTGNVFDGGISDQFMQAVGLQGIYDAGALYDAYESRLEDQFFTFSLLIIILFTVTAFVFFSIAFLFIARFVILALLITVSPLAFAAMAIPRFNSMTGKWWTALINNTLVAPAVLLMLLVSLKIIQDENFLKMTKGASWVDTGTASWAYLVISFGIVCGFFLASLLIAKQFSAFGASWATGLGGKIAFGATGFLGRQTLGRAGVAASQKFRSSRIGQTEMGRIAATYGIDKLGKASFDMRGGLGGGALKAMSVNAGKAQSGGRAADDKARAKAQLEYSQSLKALPEDEKQTKKLERDQKELDKKYEQQENEAKAAFVEQRDQLREELAAKKKEKRPLEQQRAEAQRELENARELGDKMAISAKTDLVTKLEHEIGQKTAEEQELEKEIEKKIKEIDQKERDLLKGIVEAKKKEVEDLKEAIGKAKNAHIERYVQSVEKSAKRAEVAADVIGNEMIGGVSVPGAKSIGKNVAGTINRMFSSGAASAKAIRKKANMSDSDKLVEDLKKELEKAGGDGDKDKKSE